MTCGRISFSIQTNELKRGSSTRSSKRNRAASPPVIVDSGLSSAALSEEDLSDKPVPEGQAAGGACFTCLFLVTESLSQSLIDLVSRSEMATFSIGFPPLRLLFSRETLLSKYTNSHVRKI